MRYERLRKALAEFVEAVENGKTPKRVYKPSGVDKKGERFEPYIRLGLWHHHLHPSGEPLLILQKVAGDDGDEMLGFALTSHADHFDGDKWMWLKEHVVAIDWSSCEDLKAKVEAYSPEPKRRR